MLAIILKISIMIMHGYFPLYTARHNVKSELIPIVNEWDDLGEALGLPDHVVQTIKANNPSNVKRCRKEVVDAWFEEKGNHPSWNNLCEALRDPLVDRKDVVSNIEKKYSL